MSKPTHLRIRHLDSKAMTRVELLGFDKHHRVAIVRYGLAGVHEFSLSSGQGTDRAISWALSDLDTVRGMAELEGLQLGPKTRIQKRTNRQSKLYSKTLPAAKQLLLFGGAK